MRPGGAARRARGGGGQGARARARARSRGDTGGRRLRLGLAGGGRGRRSARARASSAIRRRRTRRTSSSRSTPRAMEPRRILVLAGDGGRLDHQLSTLLLLGSERYAGSQVDALVGRAWVHVVRGAHARGSAGRARLAARARRAGRGRDDEGLAYPLEARRSRRGRAAASRTSSRRTRRTSRSRTACSWPIRPGEPSDKYKASAGSLVVA